MPQTVSEGQLAAAKNCFYGTFVSGMQEIIAGVVKERLPDVSVIKLLDGAIIFETGISYSGLNFFCFNNIFAVIDIEESGDDSLDLHLRKIASIKNRNSSSGKKPDGFILGEKSLEIISLNNKKIKTFRLVFSVENKPSAVNEKLKKDAENFIALASNLKPDRSNPDTEFWFLYRREGFSCFMKRLTNNQGEKALKPGELSPQLAWLLCRIADLKHDETAADPFCGYGSIPDAGLKHFPLKKFYASDIDTRCIKTASSKTALRQNTKKNRARIFQSDFLSVLTGQIKEEEIDAIVSDPPWGLFKETTLPLQTFYNEMILVFSKLLKNGGRAVILTAALKEIEEAVEASIYFEIQNTIPILVSGRKAKVFVLSFSKESKEEVENGN